MASNAEVVRELYRRADEDGRFPDELLDDEIEWVNPPDAVETGTRRGRDAFHAALESTGEVFDRIAIEPEELIDSRRSGRAALHLGGAGQGQWPRAPPAAGSRLDSARRQGNPLSLVQRPG
jgi:ketosteroid isomerase-like protein